MTKGVKLETIIALNYKGVAEVLASWACAKSEFSQSIQPGQIVVDCLHDGGKVFAETKGDVSRGFVLAEDAIFVIIASHYGVTRKDVSSLPAVGLVHVAKAMDIA